MDQLSNSKYYAKVFPATDAGNVLGLDSFLCGATYRPTSTSDIEDFYDFTSVFAGPNPQVF